MKLKVNKWKVAYRKRNEGLLNNKTEFIPVKDSIKYFIADPFLFEQSGETFLFVEYYDYRIRRGTIAYSKYDEAKGEFGPFEEIIRENYHLSYPLVFIYKDEIYLMPESSESKTLYVYKAVSFPNKWEKHAIIDNETDYVDTTPFIYDNQFYAITKDNTTPDSPMLLLKIDPSSWLISDSKIITDDVSISRPGGKVITINDQYFMVTQDCKDDYGTALNFLVFSIDDKMNVSYHPIKKVNPEDVNIQGIRNIQGIHTYNSSNDLEVIDFKYPKFAFYRRFWKLINRLKVK